MGNEPETYYRPGEPLLYEKGSFLTAQNEIKRTVLGYEVTSLGGNVSINFKKVERDPYPDER